MTFDHEVQSVPWQSVAAQLAAYDAILGLELELAERDPYRDVPGSSWLVVPSGVTDEASGTDGSRGRN